MISATEISFKQRRQKGKDWIALFRVKNLCSSKDITKRINNTRHRVGKRYV